MAAARPVDFDATVDSVVTHAPAGPAKSSRSKGAPWPWIGFGVAALSVVIGGLFALLGTSDGTRTEASAPAEAKVSAAETRAPVESVAAHEPAPIEAKPAAALSPPSDAKAPGGDQPPTQAAESVSADEPPEALGKGRIRLTSTPSGAAVYLARKKIGTTPMVLDIPQRKRRSRIALRLRGHKTWCLWIKRGRVEPVKAELVSRRRTR